MIIINGKNIAQQIIADLKNKPKPTKKLVAVLVGENPASKSFLKQKERIAGELSVQSELKEFTENITEEYLKDEIKKIGEDKTVGGIILQLPLPQGFSREEIVKTINPEKDVDNLTGQSSVLAPAVEVVRDILSSVIASERSERGNLTEEYLKDKTVAVIGHGFLVGQPVAKWLQDQGIKYKIFDLGSDLAELKDYDLVVSGVGKAGLIKSEMLKEGAGAVDFGFDMKDGKISGDLDVSNFKLETLNLKLGFYTPTPGGTGPMLVAELFRNFYRLNSQS